jgi:carbon storage regulator CsrA
VRASPPQAPAQSGHLVLTRYGMQSVMIGDDVEITVLEVLATTVKLGITAPRNVKVLRTEIADREPRGDD